MRFVYLASRPFPARWVAAVAGSCVVWYMAPAWPVARPSPQRLFRFGLDHRRFYPPFIFFWVFVYNFRKWYSIFIDAVLQPPMSDRYRSLISSVRKLCLMRSCMPSRIRSGVNYVQTSSGGTYTDTHSSTSCVDSITINFRSMFHDTQLWWWWWWWWNCLFYHALKN